MIVMATTIIMTMMEAQASSGTRRRILLGKSKMLRTLRIRRRTFFIRWGLLLIEFVLMNVLNIETPTDQENIIRN